MTDKPCEEEKIYPKSNGLRLVCKCGNAFNLAEICFEKKETPVISGDEKEKIDVLDKPKEKIDVLDEDVKADTLTESKWVGMYMTITNCERDPGVLLDISCKCGLKLIVIEIV